MGRRPGPAGMAHRGAFSRTRVLSRLYLAILLVGATIAAGTALAATLSDALTQKTQPQNNNQQRMLVNANELVFDRDKNTVTANGNVQIYYEGRVLQADHVVYDRTQDRLSAQGHVKLTDLDGSVTYSDRLELSDDFKNGFIESLRVDTAEKTHITAARAERSEGETTVFENGTYTACQPCQAHPEKPPLWQIRAMRIIHKNDEQTIYFENAYFELLGIPIAYIPYLSVPDPSVKQKSGVLAPHYYTKSALGFGVGIPIYWALAPDYDLTVTPAYLTRQGFLGSAEWRQKFINGSYNILASGIFEQDPGAFLPAPYGSGDEKFRGILQSKGEFLINQNWKFGWDATVLSDKWFLSDYGLQDQTLQSSLFKQSASTVYLTGQTGTGYFDLRGYYFQGLAQNSLQSQQPIAAPVLNYNKTFNLTPEESYGIGGQVEIDANVTSINQQLAQFQSTNGLQLDNAYNLYNVCTPQLPKGTPNAAGLYYPNNCILQGIGGDYSRATINASWQRNFIDPIGEVWNPFVFAHLSGENLDLNNSNTATFTSTAGTSTISNASQVNFIPEGSGTTGEAIPGAGLEYRYPFFASFGGVSQVLEPIAQVIARPNEQVNAATVNEDAQSLVFDDTTLFEWSKFSGDDRFEGGTRANYGGQYTATFANGGYVNIMAGQSYQLAGLNSYAMADAAAVGLDSGLQTRLSDTVARLAISPSSMFTFIAKSEFDARALQRLDLMGNINWGQLQTSLEYANYQAQPLIGYNVRREGLSAQSKYQFDTNYFATGNVIFDMSRHYYDALYDISTPLFFVAGWGLSAGYTDDCTTFSIKYTSAFVANQNGIGAPVRNQTLSLQLELRTIGDTQTEVALSNPKLQDGLAPTQ